MESSRKEPTELEIRARNSKRAEIWLRSMSLGEQDMEQGEGLPEKIELPEFLQEVMMEIQRRTIPAIGKEAYAFIQVDREDWHDGRFVATVTDVKDLSIMGISFMPFNKESSDESTFGTVHSHPDESPPSIMDINGFRAIDSEAIKIVVTRTGTLFLIAATPDTKFNTAVEIDPNKLTAKPLLQGLLQRVFQLPKEMYQYLAFLSFWEIPEKIEISILKGLNLLGFENSNMWDSLVARQTLRVLNFCEYYGFVFYRGNVEDLTLERIVP